MGTISFNIDNYINNDPVLLMIFFSLSLFGSIIRFVFTENTNRKNINAGGRLLLRMVLLSLTSSLVMFSSLNLLTRYIKGNLMYLAVFFLGFTSEMLIKQLTKIKNMNGVIKFIDDLYNFIKNRKG